MSLKLDQDYKLRDWKQADLPLILNSWIKSMGRQYLTRYAHKYAGHQHDRIMRLLTRKRLVIKVACAVDDDDEIFGYIVGEPVDRIAHYAFVKSAFQKWGVGTTLYRVMFGDHPVVCTHWTFDMTSMKGDPDNQECPKPNKLPPGLTYNPYWFEEQ